MVSLRQVRKDGKVLCACLCCFGACHIECTFNSFKKIGGNGEAEEADA